MLLFDFEKNYWCETNFKSQEKPNENYQTKKNKNNIILVYFFLCDIEKRPILLCYISLLNIIKI